MWVGVLQFLYVLWGGVVDDDTWIKATCCTGQVVHGQSEMHPGCCTVFGGVFGLLFSAASGEGGLAPFFVKDGVLSVAYSLYAGADAAYQAGGAAVGEDLGRVPEHGYRRCVLVRGVEHRCDELCQAVSELFPCLLWQRLGWSAAAVLVDVGGAWRVGALW